MNEQEYNSYIKAGQIAKQVKDFAKELIKPGMKLIDIATAIDNKIYELGGQTAFPCGLSIDEIAAHYTPVPGDERTAEGLLCIDIGVSFDGYIADTAFTLDLTENNIHKDNIELNKKILDHISEITKPNMKVCDVGNSATDTLEKWNKENNSKFSIIKGLCGHKLGHHLIHAGITIPNTRNDNQTKINDMAIAIEPFVTTGSGEIYEGKPGGILILKGEGKLRDKYSREVLDYIKKNYGTRPFCRRFLEGKNLKNLGFSLSSMEKQGIIYHYPELIERTKKPVSQFENTFIITKERVIISTE